MLGLIEDNEHSGSQAFSCCSVVFSIYVRLHAYMSVWTEGEMSAFVALPWLCRFCLMQ